MFAAARLGASDSNYIGVNYELDAIAAAVIGGTPLSGGRISILGGVFGVLSGALLAAHLSSGISTAGQGEELKSIAAAVIGGELLTGGVGTMAGALSGVLLLGLIENVIDQIGNLSSYYQNLASGVFLLIAVLIQTVLTRRRR